MLSNKSALEIIDNKYKILLNNINDNKSNMPYVLKAYLGNGIYKEKI